MIKGRALDHIGLAVTDVEVAAKWYQDTLGLKEFGKFMGGHGTYTYFLKNDNGVIYEIYQRDDLEKGAQGKVDHIAFVSNDIQADYDYCVAQGYKICTEGIEEISNRWEKGCKYFKIKSPTGEEVEYSQVL